MPLAPSTSEPAASPLSPVKPAFPLPATVMILSVAAMTSRMALLFTSPINRSPAESTATKFGAVQLGGGCEWPVVAAVTRFAVTGDGDDVPGRGDDLADHVGVAPVGEEHVPGQSRRRGRGGGLSISASIAGFVDHAVTRSAVTGDGDDFVDQRDDLTDSVVARVGDEQVACSIDGDAVGAIQFGGSRADRCTAGPRLCRRRRRW